MLSFTFCVVRYKGDWTKAYHYAAVLLAESRWSKVKTFDIYHVRAHSFLLLDPVSRETLTSVPFSLYRRLTCIWRHHSELWRDWQTNRLQRRMMKERKTQRNTCSGSVLPQTDQHLAVESFQTQLSCNVCTQHSFIRGCVINKSYRKAAPFKTFT